MQVVAIVGRSGVGKTHLVESILPLLREHGYRVATVKHTHHRVHTDKSGSDTQRHLSAGAQRSVLAGPGFCTVFADSEPPFEQVVQLAGWQADLVLVEGYKSSSVPKIEVVRESEPMLPDDEVWMRVTSDQAADVVDSLKVLLNRNPGHSERGVGVKEKPNRVE